jgi:hypothetical protein
MKPIRLTEIPIEANRTGTRSQNRLSAKGMAGAPPDAVKENADISQEELARRLAASSGAQASIPEKTAESVG